MPFSDYVPRLGRGNFWVNYNNVLGVPIHKRIVIAVVAVFSLFTVFVCAFIFAKSEKRTPSSHAAYQTSYVSMSSAMNLSVDPCSNFYEFTCGLWGKNKAISDNSHKRITAYSLTQDYIASKRVAIFENTNISSEFPSGVNDALNFFRACISEKSDKKGDLSYLNKYLEDILGEWPMFRHSNDSSFEWKKASALLLKTLGVKTLFDLHITPDDSDSSHVILFLKATDFPDFPLDPDSSTTMEMLYSVFSALNHNLQPDAADVYENITNSERKWFNLFSNLTVKSQELKTSLKHLNNLIPEIDWVLYFQTVMSDTLGKLGIIVKEDDIVLIDNIEAIKNAVAFFSSNTLSKKDIANLFGWLAVKNFWALIPGVSQEYATLLSYTSDELIQSRHICCFNYLDEIYRSSVDFLLVRNSSLSCIPVGKVLVDYLKRALQTHLTSSAWLDSSTKEYAKLKLDSMQSVIGFKSYLNNKTELEQVLNNLPELKPSLLQTYIEISEYFLSRDFIALKSNTPKSEYLMPRSITEVGAYYNAQRNRFTLPISIFSPPFYHSLGPMYLNFGALGSIVGHEIMHGFDRHGCKRDKTGSLKEWWTEQTYKEYTKRSQCFTEQYTSYLDHLLPSDLNSMVANKTRDEDVADNEGLQIAYLAYQQWVKDHKSENVYEMGFRKFSPEQMFFISFGSVWCTRMESGWTENVVTNRHSIPMLRVNGAVSNSGDFSKAFHCPKGSPMNPAKKCVLW